MTINGVTQVDQTRCGVIRRRFYKHAKNIFNSLKREVVEYLEQDFPSTTNAKQLRMTEKRLEVFEKWLKERFHKKVTKESRVRGQTNWWKVFIQESYEKGRSRSLLGKLPKSTKKEQTLLLALGRGAREEKLKFLALHAFKDIRGLTEDSSQKIVKEILEGSLVGKSLREIIQSISKRFKIDISRVTSIIRTEITRAHAEGQLDALETLGVKKVQIRVEWLTSKGACPTCLSYAKKKSYTIQEARGLIPVHPRCQCAFAEYKPPLKRKK